MDTKIKMILCSALILFGIIEVVCFCDNTNKDINIKDSKEQQVTNTNTSNISTLRVKTFSYNKHKYIKFTSGKESGYVHDPDCPCQNKTSNK